MHDVTVTRSYERHTGSDGHGAVPARYPIGRSLGRGVRMLFLLWAVGEALPVSSSLAADLYVWASSPDPQPKHGTWHYAAHTIEDALQWAENGDTVIVTDGVYRLSGPLVIDRGVTVRSVNGASHTIVDADHAGCAFDVQGNSVVLDGFTIRNGYASGGDPDGGGVRLNGGGRVQNCVITGNVSEGVGGGVYSPGGGGPGGEVRNCLVTGNSAIRGGGIYSEAGLVVNCTLAGNAASIAGGGLLSQTGTVRNCILWSNTAPAGANFSDDGGASLYRHCCTTPTNALPPGSTACLEGDPRFDAPATGSYRLTPASPCLDSGTNLDWMTTAVDLDGRPRVLDSVVDMGAYEFGWTILSTAGPNGAISPSGTVWVGHGGSQAFALTPAPFYQVENISVDGEAVAPATSYVFMNVETNHTLHAVFARDPTNYLYVATNGGHVTPFASWGTAATNIEAAVAAAPTGITVVVVSNGFYRQTQRVMLTNGITVRGFAGASNTVFDGEYIGGGFHVDHAVVEDLTITRCTNASGGAVYLAGSGIVQRCILGGNRAVCGGGVFWERGGIVRECVIVTNWARLGGGVFCSSLTGSLTSCKILVNMALDPSIATSQGGGVYSAGAELTLQDCEISGNYAGQHVAMRYGYGGGVYMHDAGRVVGCIIASNTCGGSDGAAGGGLHVGAGTVISNCVIEKNLAWTHDIDLSVGSANGGGIYIGDGAVLSCRVSGNRALAIITARGGGLYSGARVEDCLILENSADAPRSSTVAQGGGIYQVGATVACCQVVGNRARGHFTTDGGGIFIGDIPGEIRDCVIEANLADGSPGTGSLYANGGGVYARGATVRRCRLAGNRADSDTAVKGGGVYTDGFLYECTVWSNACNAQEDSQGGGVWGSAPLVNCLIYGNEATALHHPYGGGVYALGALVHCTIVSNRVSQGDDGTGGGAYGGAATNCILVSNHAQSAGSNYFGGSRASCWVNADPLFEDPGQADYRLRAGSPCLDAGADAPPFSDFDLDGTPRPLDGDADGASAVDIGAYEYASALADTDGDTMRDAWEVAHGLNPVQQAGQETDSDGDGVPDRDEHTADTDPTNAVSNFRIVASSCSPSLSVWFLSSSNRVYLLESAPSLVGHGWVPVAGHVPRLGTGFLDCLTDTNAAPASFLRVSVAVP